MTRLERAEWRVPRVRRSPTDRADRLVRAPLAFLLAHRPGPRHACFWPGDVLVVYAVLGFALLAHASRDRTLVVLALLGALPRPAGGRRGAAAILFSNDRDASPRSSTGSRSHPTTSPSATAPSATPWSRRRASSSGATPRRSASHAYAVFYVQMATGILAGLLRRPPRLAAISAERRRDAVARPAHGSALRRSRSSRRRASLVSWRSMSALRRGRGVSVGARTNDRSRRADRPSMRSPSSGSSCGRRAAPRWLRSARPRRPHAAHQLPDADRCSRPLPLSTAGASAAGAASGRRWRRSSPSRSSPSCNCRSAPGGCRAIATGRSKLRCWRRLTYGRRGALEARTRSASKAYERRRTAGSWAQVLITTSSSSKCRGEPARACSATSAAEPTKAFPRIGASALVGSVKPRAAMTSGDCSGPNTPRARSMRQRSRDSARCAASSSLSAASAQTQSVACGFGCRSLGWTGADTAPSPARAFAVGEEIGEGVRQAEVRRELRAVVGAAEDPDLGRVRPERMRGDAVVRAERRSTPAGRAPIGKSSARLAGVRIERARGAHVAARRAADAEVDAARRERLQHAELLGDLQRAVVRQHDAGAADADRRRARRDRRHQDLGRAADDRRQAVVLADPEARIAEPLAMLGERRACRGSRRLRCCRRARRIDRERRGASVMVSRADASGRSSARSRAFRPARCRG